MATPAACLSIESNLKKKRDQLNRLNNSRPSSGGGPVVKPGQNRDPELEAERKRLSAEIRKLDAQLTQCVVQHTANAPVTVRFERLYCDDQNDTEKSWPDIEDDEPYLLVYVLNLPRSTNVNPLNLRPDARMFQIGPFHRVDSGETVYRNTNVWDTTGTPRIINNPDDVTILVALMEEDSTGASSVRTNTETMMLAEIAKAAPVLATDPEAFRARLIEGMRGAIQTTVKAGFINNDDRIGPVQQIRLTRPILDGVRRSGSHPFHLHFSGASARYSATFNLVRP